MKKLILTLIIFVCFISLASAQTNYIPDYQFGIKGGADYSMFPAYQGLHNQGKVGYIGGFWGRIGGAGLFFQPELYATAKDVTVTQPADGTVFLNRAKFTNVDVPLLVGDKIGDASFGVRFYAGPVVSFAVSKSQDFLNTSAATHLNYNDENISAQLGAGFDYKSFSIDVRYEAGINKVEYGPTPTSHTRLNLINITLAYSIFSDFN